MAPDSKLPRAQSDAGPALLFARDAMVGASCSSKCPILSSKCPILSHATCVGARWFRAHRSGTCFVAGSTRACLLGHLRGSAAEWGLSVVWTRRSGEYLNGCGAARIERVSATCCYLGVVTTTVQGRLERLLSAPKLLPHPCPSSPLVPPESP